jgi:hypothetical protein
MGKSVYSNWLAPFIILGGLLASGSAYAGYGAIAYSPSTGEIGYSDGYDYYAEAVSAALSECVYSDCSLINWEENECNAFATGSGGVWGESNGYGNTNSAVNAAVGACGATCSWRVWICN